MRLHRYGGFVEALAISANDKPVTTMAKQDVNADEACLKEYNAKKDGLKKIFLDVDADGEFVNDDAKLKEELEKLLGKEENREGTDRNDLLQQLTIVLDLQRQLAHIQRKSNKDKERMDEVGDEAAIEEGPRKEELNKRLDDIKKQASTNTDTIADLSRKITDAEKEFKDKMSEFLANMQSSVDTIKKTQPK